MQSAPETSFGTHTVETESHVLGSVTVRVSDFSAPGRCYLLAPALGQTRLSIVLQEVGGTTEPRLDPSLPYIKPHVRNEVALLPPGTRLGMYTEGIRRLQVLSLLFDWTELRSLSDAIAPTPRLQTCQRDDGMLQLARLLTEALSGKGVPPGEAQLHLRYARTLVDALLLRLARTRLAEAPRRTGLSRAELQRVVHAIERSTGAELDIGELARSVGRSQSQFYKEFKLATGLPPYRFHLDARIRKAQALLHRQRLALSEVAAATGFADQSHFTRVFKQFVGCTPKAWLSAARSGAHVL